jgi:hypothetical protein
MEELSKNVQNSLQHNHLYILISNHARGQYNQESLVLNFNRPSLKKIVRINQLFHLACIFSHKQQTSEQSRSDWQSKID